VRTEGATALAADALHVAAAAAWTGGLATLVAALALAGPARWDLAARAVPRFSALALLGVAVLVASGVWSSVVHVGSWGGLVQGLYGPLLLAKIGLLAALVALGAWQNRVAVPALGTGDTSVRRRFLAVCGAELALMAGAIGVTAVLVAQPPPSARATAPAAADGPVTATAALGPYRLEVRVDPAAAGANRVDLRVSRPGAPAPAPAEVRLDAALPAAGIPPIDIEIAALHGAHAVAPRVRLPLPGDWELRVRARFGEFEQHTTTITVPIAKERSHAHSHRNHPRPGGDAGPGAGGNGARDGQPG
jgi:copper transport protein